MTTNDEAKKIKTLCCAIPAIPSSLTVSFRPFYIGVDNPVLFEFVEGVELPAQDLFREFPVNKSVTSPANIDSSFPHIRFVKVLFKPLIAVTGLWDKMMEGNELVGTAESAHLTHYMSILD